MAETVLMASLKSLGLSNQPLGGAEGIAGRTVANFVMQHQLQTQWCWAAVSASVTDLHQRPMTQCAIVNLTRSLNGCCESGSSSSCNQPWYLDQALFKTGNQAQMIEQYLPWSKLMSEIDAGRPVGVRTGWTNGGGHFLAVRGYDPSGIIEVGDPWYGDSPVNYNTFISSYLGAGKWTHSYLTTPVNSTSNPAQPSGASTPSNDPWHPSSGCSTVPPPTQTNPAPYDPWQPH